jgi:ubiquinone/menaquinone biosynthesis C-methylase UbiE
MSSFDQDIDDAVTSAPLARIFADAFDATAPRGVLGFSFVTMAGLRHIGDLLAASRPRRLLDAGCGWGGPGLWLADAIGCDLIGVDSSRVGVEWARKRAADGQARATFSVGTMEATGLTDDSVDAVVGVDALHFAPDPLAAARELLRVVRPGGRIVVTLWSTAEGPERFTRDYPAVLAEAGWSVEQVEDHPEWLAAQLRLYAAALDLPEAETDAAVQRLRREGTAVVPVIEHARRLLITATRTT